MHIYLELVQKTQRDKDAESPISDESGSDDDEISRNVAWDPLINRERRIWLASILRHTYKQGLSTKWNFSINSTNDKIYGTVSVEATHERWIAKPSRE